MSWIRLKNISKSYDRTTIFREIHFKLLSLHRDLFCEASPAPAKWALHRLGRCRPTVRLPLVELTAAGQATVEAALKDCGLI